MMTTVLARGGVHSSIVCGLFVDDDRFLFPSLSLSRIVETTKEKNVFYRMVEAESHSIDDKETKLNWRIDDEVF